MDDIFDNKLRLYAGAVGDHFILMDDISRPYRARVVNDHLKMESIERIDWSKS
jgi:hypothetical protein